VLVTSYAHRAIFVLFLLCADRFHPTVDRFCESRYRPATPLPILMP
jgi:hypothetical protein